MAQAEEPFTLHVSDADLDLLRKKLDLVRFPDELDDAGSEYGAPLAHIKRLVARWKSGYDWRKSEQEINKLPQFTRDIPVDGFDILNIHYLHQKSLLDNAIPLLFIHGWPGHFLEVRKMLPLLTSASPAHPSFHVVALSLPGFGFSEAPKKRGFGQRQYAEVANKLMNSLEYKEYVVQGGDWGHYIAAYLSTHHGHTNVKGWLSNFPNAVPPTFFSAPWLYLTHLITPYSEREKTGLARTLRFRQQGSGYSHEQATKPQTLGYSLADSPVGLLGWIYEKLASWSDSYLWEDDEVLEWVSIYWFSRAGPAASLRIYKESTDSFSHSAIRDVKWTSVPLGFATFPKELTAVPDKWLRTLGNVVFHSVHEHGGHFAAHEQPESLVKDIRDMFGKSGPAFAVVLNKNGYA